MQKSWGTKPAVDAAGSGHVPEESCIVLMRPEPGSATSTEQLSRHCTSQTSETRASAAFPSTSPALPQTPAYVLTTPAMYG